MAALSRPDAILPSFLPSSAASPSAFSAFAIPTRFPLAVARVCGVRDLLREVESRDG